MKICNGQKDRFKEKFGEPLTFAKFYQFIKKKGQFIFPWDIPDRSCPCEIFENATLMVKPAQKEKKAIQQHHMILSKSTRAIPAMKIALIADVENAL